MPRLRLRAALFVPELTCRHGRRPAMALAFDDPEVKKACSLFSPQLVDRIMPSSLVA